MKNNYLLTIIVAVIFGAVGFFGGMKYQQARRSTVFRQFGNGQFRNTVGVNGQQTGGTRQGFRLVNGEIIAADSKSITVKLQDGSSRIVLVSDQTSINKAETATMSDLKTGEKVAVFGTENSDGSVTAQNIQLNPILRNMNGGTPGR